jgi:peroxiredoxin
VSDKELSDEEWLKQLREQDARFPDADELLLPRFLTFAAAHRDSRFALDALAFVIRRGGPQTGDVVGKPWQLQETAIDAVSADHMHDSRIVHVLDMLSGSIPSPKTEAFLRKAFEQSSERTVQAAAGLSLARYYCTTCKCLERCKKIQAKDRPLNNERFWKLVVAPYLQSLRVDHTKVSAEADRLLAGIVEQYSDVEALDWELTGKGQFFLQTVPYARSKSYADLARTLQFERNNLVAGKLAPDIDGSDTEGARFRLSDYRGKVILLTFSANWCGGCVELYPLQRKLVDKFKDEAFAILSVSRDESVDTLKESLASGKITWRCWWDGMQGPIYEAWNSPGAPTLFLLNHEGIIQDAGLNRSTPQEEFERTIAALLKNAPRR